LAGYSLWRLREKTSFDHAAASIDLKAGLNDEIKTAFWFIRNPIASVWVDTQIHRAARKAGKIDVRRVYPGTIPRTSYAAAAMVVIFIALHFVVLPRPSEAVQPTGDTAKPAVSNTVDVKAINEGLDEIAEELAKSEKLKAVAEALLERRWMMPPASCAEWAPSSRRSRPIHLRPYRKALAPQDKIEERLSSL
jgi:hypothetical protein